MKQARYRRIGNWLEELHRAGFRQLFFYHVYRKSNLKRFKIAGHEVWVRPGTPDLRVAVKSLGDEYLPLSRMLPADYDGLIVDAGGYIGTAALKLNELFPNATIVSIEPSDENFDVLVKNTRDRRNIHCVNAALGVPGSGKRRLANRGTGEWGFTIVDNPRDNASPQFMGLVETVSLCDLCERFGFASIGVLKLDIEGAEKELFIHDAHGLSKIPIIFVELHDRIVKGCSTAFFDFSARRWVVRTAGEKYLSVFGGR